MTLLADVVTASQEVAETSARSRKVTILAELLERLDPAEVAVATELLSGVPRQGRVGIGTLRHAPEVAGARRDAVSTQHRTDARDPITNVMDYVDDVAMERVI